MSSINSSVAKTEDLLRTLKSTGQELGHLIDTARELLSNSAHAIPRKISYLLDWTTNLLIKTSSRHIDPEKSWKEGVKLIFLDPTVWKFFNDLLLLSFNQTSVTVHPSIIQVVQNAYNHLCYRQLNINSSEHSDEFAYTIEKTLDLLFNRRSNFLRPRLDQVSPLVASLSQMWLNLTQKQVYSLDGATTVSKVWISLSGMLQSSLVLFRRLSTDNASPSKIFSLFVDEHLTALMTIQSKWRRQFRPDLAASRRGRQASNQPPADSSYDSFYNIEIIIDRMDTLSILISQTVQAILFNATTLDDFHSGMSSHIKFNKDVFTITKTQKSATPLVSQPPDAKRKRGSNDTPKATYTTSIDSVSTSYTKKLFDKLTKSVEESNYDPKQLSVATSGISHLFELALGSIFPNASGPHEHQITNLYNSINNHNTGEFHPEASIQNLSLQTLQALWCLFCAFQQVLFPPSVNVVSSNSFSNVTIRLQANSSLMKLFLDYNIGREMINNDDCRTYLEQLTSFLISLIRAIPSLDAAYGSLKLIADISYTLIEPHLDFLICNLWLQPTVEQNAQSSQADLWIAKIVEIYGRMRQIDVLLERILVLAKSNEVRSFFGYNFWLSFKISMTELPPGILVPIFNLFMDNLRHYIATVTEKEDLTMETFGMFALNTDLQSTSTSSRILIHDEDNITKTDSLSSGGYFHDENIVHVSSILSTFLENIRLSPIIAQQICSYLTTVVNSVCKPLLQKSLDNAEQYFTLYKKKGEKKAKKFLKKSCSAGSQSQQLASMTLYHIFDSFEIYCKNRFLPARTIPEDVNLKDEQLKPYFSKLDSTLPLADYATQLLLQLEFSNSTGLQFKSFITTLFKMVLQRCIELSKLGAACPPASLISLASRYDQVQELQNESQEELQSLMGTLELIYTSLVDGRWKSITEHSHADCLNILPLIWDNLCAHVGMITNNASPNFSKALLRGILLLQQENLSKIGPSQLAHLLCSETGGLELTSAIAQYCSVSASKVLVEANFYEEPGTSRHLVRSLLQVLKEQIQNLLYDFEQSIPPSPPYNQIAYMAALLSELPTNFLRTSHLKDSLPTIFRLAKLALEHNLPSLCTIAILRALRTILEHPRLSLDDFIEIEEIGTKSLSNFASQVLDLSRLGINQYGTLATDYILSAFCYQLVRSGSKNDKLLSKLHKRAMLLNSPDRDFSLHALLSGVLNGLLSMESEARDQFEYVRQMQRNQIRGWQPPAPASISFSKKLQSVLAKSTSYILDTINDSSFSSKEGYSYVLPLCLSAVLAQLQRLMKSRFAECHSPPDDIEHRIPGSKILSCCFSAFISMRVKHFELARAEQIETNSSWQIGTCCAKALLYICECVTMPQIDVVGDKFSELLALVFSMDVQTVPNIQPNTDILLAALIPKLNHSQSRILLSFLCHELRQLINNHRTELSSNMTFSNSSIDSTPFFMLKLITALRWIDKWVPMIDSSIAYTIMSGYSSTIISCLTTILQQATLPFLSSPLGYNTHILCIRSLTNLISDKFVEISGNDISTIIQGLNSLISKYHSMDDAPLFLKGVSKEFNVIRYFTQFDVDELAQPVPLAVEDDVPETSMELDLPTAHHHHGNTNAYDQSQSEGTSLDLHSDIDIMAKHLAIIKTDSMSNLKVPIHVWRQTAIDLFSAESFSAHYHLLNAVIHDRPAQATKNISSVIIHSKILLQVLVMLYSSDFVSKPAGHPRIGKLQADYVGRLFAAIANLGSYIRFYAVPILIDYISMQTKETVHPQVKKAIDLGMFPFLALLEESDQNFILKNLDSTGKAIFRQLHSEFERDFKYQGKA